MYKSRINKIQEYLRANNIDGYIIFISDDHGSEYITDRFKTVAFFSNFTGSAATLLITKEKSYLWTDGRYFLQAEEQLKASNTILMKIGIDKPLVEFVNGFKTLAFDFKVANVSFISSLNANIKLIDESKIIDKIWNNRPKMSKSKIRLLPDKVVSKSIGYKCNKTLKYRGNHGVLITALDDIAYLLNSRGNDIKYNPVFMAFMFLSKIDGVGSYVLYINKAKLTPEIIKQYTKENIVIKPYNDVYKDVKNFKYKIYFDSTKTNYKLLTLMNNYQKVTLYPTLAKAIKSNVDIKESKKAHVKDAIAMCKFLYYINKNVKNNDLDEIKVSNYLEKLRRKQGAYELSFNTICGYKEHGAIIHYGATKETNAKIYNDGFLLVDSGGQYNYGTTDITRTIALDNITDKMKYHFTLVLKAHIDLAKAIFTKNTLDSSLDLIARKPLWDNNLDYNHGTGHGVGHILNVHEGPQSIRHNKVKPTIMKKGMITSNEPGLYFENEYGIRHENEILCVKIDKDHLGFEPITYVPFDIKAIDVNLLDEEERKWLNDYHKMVYNIVAKHLTNKERIFLKEITKEI